MSLCLCGSKNDFSSCCGLYLKGKSIPLTADALMRSRYTAYAMADIPYIVKTMRGKPLNDFNAAQSRSWAEKVIWIGLDVLNAQCDKPDLAYVEFIARFIEGSQLKCIHELSEFHREAGQWVYVNGVQRESGQLFKNQKIGRNTICPCGSQKKFKNCHEK